MFYIINKYFQVYFFTNQWNTTFTFLMSVLVSLEVSFNGSFYFGHDK